MKANLFTNESVSSRRVIYTPSEFARTNLLHIQEIGMLTAVKPHVSSRSELVSYLFFLVTGGSGTMVYEGRTYHLKAGDAVFLDCRKSYSQSSSEDLWSLVWCHFYGPNLQGIYRKYKERGGYAVFRPENFEEYQNLMMEMFDICSSDFYTRDMRIYEKLAMLLTRIMEESWHPETSALSKAQKRNMLEVKDYIDLHYREKLTLEGIADQFYINKSYLARLFKEQIGVTVTTYIKQVRITKAKEMLRFREDTVEAIAAECGISDPNYFSRMFRKIEGIAPGEYRRMWRSEN